MQLLWSVLLQLVIMLDERVITVIAAAPVGFHFALRPRRHSGDFLSFPAQRESVTFPSAAAAILEIMQLPIILRMRNAAVIKTNLGTQFFFFATKISMI